MRCKLCETPHKNRGKSPLWLEFQVCRACSYVLDVFSWNANYLKEYWGLSDHDFIVHSSSYRVGGN